MATEIKSRDDLKRWLDGRSVAEARVIASRAALRVLPLISGIDLFLYDRRRNVAISTSSVFRASSLAWVASKYPRQTNDLSRVKARTVADYALWASVLPEDIDPSELAAIFDPTNAALAAAAAVRTAYYADAANSSANTANYAATGAIEEKVWQSVSADALALSEGLAPELQANRPLWPGGVPLHVSAEWQKLIQSLPPNEDWDIWTAWYERRLTGRLYPESYELVFARVPDEAWKKGPAAANAWIKAELAKLEPPPIPQQGAGPHVEIDIETGLVIPAKPASLDEAGNHIGRLKSLHPQVRQWSQDLRDSLGRSNEHRELLEAVSRYDDLVQQPLEDIDFDRLWGEGVFLEEAAAAAERRIEDVFSEPLSDEREAKLKTLLKVHGPFILASKAGQENFAAANAYELRPDEIREQQAAAQELAEAFKSHPEVIAPETAQLFADAVAQPESSAHPERSAAFKAGFGLNIAIVIASAAAIYSAAGIVGVGIGTAVGSVIGTAAGAGMALPLLKSLERSKRFLNITGLLAGVIDEFSINDYVAAAKKLRNVRFDDYRIFMLELEDLLCRYAGTRKQNRWLNEHLDWLKNVGPEK
jgi:hypothetical protein